MSSSDRERWLQAAQRAQARRRWTIVVASVVAIVVVVAVVRLVDRSGAVEHLRAAAPAAVAPADPDADDQAEPQPVAAARRAIASGTPAAAPAVGPSADPRSPAVAAARRDAEQSAGSDRLPYLGEVVEVGVSTPVTPKSFPARLRNPDQVVRLVRDHYPPHLRPGGFGGTVVVGVLVDERGGVLDTRIVRASGFPELNAAARQVAARMQFSPELRFGRMSTTWVEVPLVFGP